MKKFYLHNGTMQEGPFDYDELKAKSITRTTPVWYEPMPNWIAAGEITELKPMFAPVPPPYTPNTPPPQPVYEPVYDAPKSGITVRRLLYAGIAIVILIAGMYMYNNLKQQQTLQTQNDIKEDIRNNINRYVKANGGTFKVDILGGISDLKVTVSNTSNYLLDDVRVQVSYIKANGEIWKNEYIDFPYLQANNEMTLDAPNSTRGTGVSIKIIRIKSAALGME